MLRRFSPIRSLLILLGPLLLIGGLSGCRLEGLELIPPGSTPSAELGARLFQQKASTLARLVAELADSPPRTSRQARHIPSTTGIVRAMIMTITHSAGAAVNT
jgi:hypothetical protein